MANIKLKDKQGTETTYTGVTKVLIPKADGSGNEEFSIGGGSGGDYNINQIIDGDECELEITDASGGGGGIETCILTIDNTGPVPSRWEGTINYIDKNLVLQTITTDQVKYYELEIFKNSILVITDYDGDGAPYTSGDIQMIRASINVGGYFIYGDSTFSL